MPKYIIEREIPGAGQLSPEQITDIAQRSCAVLHGLGPSIQWIHSYVTDDRFYCIYVAPDEQMVLAHARQGGFPADLIARVHQIVEPVTAEAAAVSR
ncbi:MAG: DUF4242 domain-containing protein [Longimicrobiales bacterium]